MIKNNINCSNTKSEKGDGGVKAPPIPTLMTVDLHIHSEFSSDGFFSVEEIFEMGKNQGMKAMIIADHDTLLAVPKALELSAQTGIKTLPALELSTIDENRMVHILGYGVSLDSNSELCRLIDEIRQSRFDILPKIKKNLEDFGFIVNLDRVLELAAPSAPVITNFANAVVDDERNRNHPDMWKYLSGGPKSKNPYISFIKDYLVAGTKGYVAEYIVDIYEGITAIAKSGGVPVIAHPGEWFGPKDEEKLPKMVECGLMGMEVYTPYHTPEKEIYFKRLTAEKNLIATGGSDFHSEKRKPGHLLGGISHADMDMFESLITRR